MPQIIPIKELKNTSEISEMCHRTEEPIYITKNGYGDMVIMSMENYESTMKQLAMYRDIEISERQIETGQVKESMVYKLNVTDHADELLDNLVYHLIYRLKNKEAAKHLLDSVESIYDRLVENPYQFPKSRDMYLAKKGYYEAVIPQMNYIVIFDVRKDIVNIVGIFHQLKNYLSKL